MPDSVIAYITHDDRSNVLSASGFVIARVTLFAELACCVHISPAEIITQTHWRGRLVETLTAAASEECSPERYIVTRH